MNNNFTKRSRLLSSTAACLSLLCFSHTAQAFTYQTDSGVVIRLDNTVQYTVIERTAPESPIFANSANVNDGDNNLRAGIVSDRLDLLSTFDISDNGYGFDASADSFYDFVYNQKTQNRSGATYNAAQQPADKFTNEAVSQAGRNIEPRNLFIYGSPTIAGIPFTVHIGRLVNIFGESLLFASNGIGYGMAPLDLERAASVPNTQAKDLFLPVGQALVSAQLTDSVTVSAYYEFEWEKYNFPASGDYFSAGDFIGPGGERILIKTLSPYVSPAVPGSAAYVYHGRDLDGADTGQFGASLHYDPQAIPWDFGFYALQYNDTEPQFYTDLKGGAPTLVKGTAPGSPTAFSLGTYQAVYAKGIQIYGASGSTTVGPFNFAGEASVRANEDLRSTVSLAPGQTAGNNESDAAYAIGDVAHYQVSEVYTGPGFAGLWDASSVSGEAAGEDLFAIVKNKANFNRAASQHAAFGIRTIGTVTYFEVLPGLDISPSLGIGWNFMGKSPDTGGFNGTGIDRGGDFTFGLSGTYLNVWTGGIKYTYYTAPAGRDVYTDRDFVSFNIERTF